MTIDVYEEATRLKNRYEMCGEMLTYLSDTDKQKGAKFQNLVKTFFNEYRDELLVFVNDQYVKAGMAFEDLQTCDCKKDDDNSTEQENPV